MSHESLPKKAKWLVQKCLLQKLAQEEDRYPVFDKFAQFPESRLHQIKPPTWAGRLQNIFGTHRRGPNSRY